LVQSKEKIVPLAGGFANCIVDLNSSFFQPAGYFGNVDGRVGVKINGAMLVQILAEPVWPQSDCGRLVEISR
jgi:hypothetical protein